MNCIVAAEGDIASYSGLGEVALQKWFEHFCRVVPEDFDPNRTDITASRFSITQLTQCLDCIENQVRLALASLRCRREAYRHTNRFDGLYRKTHEREHLRSELMWPRVDGKCANRERSGRKEPVAMPPWHPVEIPASPPLPANSGAPIRCLRYSTRRPCG